MQSLEQVVEFYKNERNLKVLYKTFEQNVIDNLTLFNQFENTPGFGELPFSWSWYLLIKSMPETFTFLEIGVYKGRVLALVQMVANMLAKNVKIYGITPLDGNATDKYSEYEKTDYLQSIKKSYQISNSTFKNTKIIIGYSQKEDIIRKASEVQYDIIFIDGCHDYDIVCSDITNYTPFLKVGGYLVLDDANLYLEGAYGIFLGHPDVGKAIEDCIHSDFVELYAIGHNRIWKKVI